MSEWVCWEIMKKLNYLCLKKISGRIMDGEHVQKIDEVKINEVYHVRKKSPLCTSSALQFFLDDFYRKISKEYCNNK